MACAKAGLAPGRDHDLSAIRGIGSTGSPLPPEGFRWVYQRVGSDLLLGSFSGGTDLCTGFVGPSPWLPVRTGVIAGRCLGARVEAFGPGGRPVTGRMGELVITAPMPSGSGMTPAASATGRATSPRIRECGGTATGSPCCRTADA
jgi:acetoacetyl-CoA synthetase